MVDHPYAILDATETAGLPSSPRGRTTIRRIVLHHALTASVAGAIRALKSTDTSTHYIIGPDGSITRVVDDVAKAWHAGPANADSIGIDLVNPLSPRRWKGIVAQTWPAVVEGAPFGERTRATAPFFSRKKGYIPDTPAALKAAQWLVRRLCAQHGIPETYAPSGETGEGDWGIVAHGTIQPGRRWDGRATLRSWEMGAG